MAKAALLGHLGTDHDGFGPTPIIQASQTVKIDNTPVARKGDPLAAHDKPKHSPHPRSIKEGSSTVFIEGQAAARIGDAVNCGGVIVGGSSVNIG